MTPSELRAAARALIDEPPSDLAGVWPRAAALLGRQAIEAEINAALPDGLQRCSMRAKLACLAELGDADEAARAALSWATLSAVTHQRGYDLAPVIEELRPWL